MRGSSQLRRGRRTLACTASSSLSSIFRFCKTGAKSHVSVSFFQNALNLHSVPLCYSLGTRETDHCFPMREKHQDMLLVEERDAGSERKAAYTARLHWDTEPNSSKCHGPLARPGLSSPLPGCFSTKHPTLSLETNYKRDKAENENLCEKLHSSQKHLLRMKMRN